VKLPPRLERLRRRHVPDAPLGVPAHQTLLYPFVPADVLDATVRARLATIFTTTPAFDFELAKIARWPDTLYVRPAPAAPFASLATRLAEAWPEYPLYGRGVGFAAHVTIAEPADALSDAELAEACTELPARRRAAVATVIAEGRDGHWRTRWRFRLSGG